MRLFVIAPFAFCICALPASAQESADALYASARAAVARSDCRTAVPLLERYKKMEAANLAAHPEFAASINLQIGKCSPLQTRLLRDKVIIDGRPIGMNASIE
ncbi:hypothetical protein ACQKOH_12545 [Sphingomonas sp. NPDC092331]|jgi:hypothetical protein|uniref:hypothetical protein n=1 Tax=unclassified Sphingomonas TaxID=196159 RepID=UPI0031F4862F